MLIVAKFITDHLLCDRVTDNCDHTPSGHQSIITSQSASVAESVAAVDASRSFVYALQRLKSEFCCRHKRFHQEMNM